MKNFFDLLFILNGTLGLMCFFLVVLSIQKNRTVNIYLALILFLVSLRLILRGYIELTHNTELFQALSSYDVFFIVFPIPYLYLRNLVFKKSIFKRSYLYHFIIPALITIENNYHLFEKLFRFELNFLMKSLIISIVVYYAVTSFILLRKSFWRKTSGIELKTEHETLMKKWTIVFYIAFIISAIKVIWDQLFLTKTDFLSENFFTWISWLVVFVIILSSPSILNVYITIISKEREDKPSVISNWRLKSINQISNIQDLQLSEKINDELDVYFQQIDEFIEKEHFFRQSGLSLNDLAVKLKIPKSHLSFIFKYHSSISFSDFKKLIRIQDAIGLIDEGYLKTNTFDSLSKEVGFSTYNTFFIAFKEVTGSAPQEYVTGLNSSD
jgi:AraC-like DNA-binding protein